MADLAGWWDDYFFGTVVVLQVFFVALCLSMLFGLIGAAARLSQSRIANGIAKIYIMVFRGTPELLILLIFYYGIAVTLTNVARYFEPTAGFVNFPPFWAGATAIGLIVGAYMTETFRGAFQGVDSGQVEAAQALGMSRFQVFVYVRMPQMWRLALPNFGNHSLSVMKDTALISIIGVQEIMFVAEMATTVTRKPFTMYITVAMIYLLITTFITISIAFLEGYANRHLRGSR